MKTFPLLSVAILAATLSACNSTNKNVSATITADNVPILALKPTNKVASVTLVNQAPTQQYINGLSLSMKATYNLADLTSLDIMQEGRTLSSAHLDIQGKEATIDCSLHVSLTDTLRLDICLQLADSIELFNKISINDLQVSTKQGTVKTDCTQLPQLRVGIALRQHGQDGVHTTRIPGLTVTPRGTLIAMYDARRNQRDDLQGDIDICYNRSIDGGRSWSPMMTAIDMGEWGGLPQKYNGVSDGSVTCDTTTGKLYICGVWMHGILDPLTGKWVEGLTEESTAWNHQWREHGSQPGYDIKQSSQFLMVESADDGLTWSTPRNLTHDIKPEQWWLLAPAPGAGITLADGTLVIPAEGRDETGLQVTTIIYSRDHGVSWQAGNVATTNSNENMVIQLADGSLMLNARERSNRGKTKGNGRAIAVSSDLGATWTEHATSRSALIEPACQASLIKHNGIVYFFNPNHTHKRVSHTLKVSRDDGNTWPQAYWIELDANQGAGYSCMAVWNDELCILYEGSGSDLVFQKIKLSEIAEHF